MSSTAASTPWNRTDAVTSAVLMAVGALVLVAGWWEVSDRASMESQIPAFNIAVLGMVLIGAGQGLWFLRGRRACSDRRRLLLGPDAAPAVISAAVEDTDSFAGTERFYHRLDCGMVSDRAWTPTSRSAHESAGRIPCGVCAP